MGMFDDFIASLNGITPDQLSTVSPRDMPTLNANAIGGAVDAFGQAAGGISHIQFGIQARQAAQFQAAQLRQNANTAEAASQRTAFDIDRQTQFITSRALAVAAGSGAGASDPTVVNLIARDAGEGAYQKQLALYGGTDRARLDLENADAKTYEGKTTFDNSLQVGAAAYAGAATNLMRSQAKGASLYARFGGGGPNIGPSTASWGADITGGGS